MSDLRATLRREEEEGFRMRRELEALTAELASRGEEIAAVRRWGMVVVVVVGGRGGA